MTALVMVAGWGSIVLGELGLGLVLLLVVGHRRISKLKQATRAIEARNEQLYKAMRDEFAPLLLQQSEQIDRLATQLTPRPPGRPKKPVEPVEPVEPVTPAHLHAMRSDLVRLAAELERPLALPPDEVKASTKRRAPRKGRDE